MILILHNHRRKKQLNPLPHMLYLEHCIIFYKLFKFLNIFQQIIYISIALKILWKMEHLLLRSKCSFLHNIFQNLTFQRRPKALVWSKGLNTHSDIFSRARGVNFGPSLHLHVHNGIDTTLCMTTCMFESEVVSRLL